MQEQKPLLVQGEPEGGEGATRDSLVQGEPEGGEGARRGRDKRFMQQQKPLLVQGEPEGGEGATLKTSGHWVNLR